jgi:hypothetical protein
MGSIVEWFWSYIGRLFVFIYCVGKGENKIVRDTYAGIEIGLSGEFPVVRVEFVHTDLRECKQVGDRGLLGDV